MNSNIKLPHWALVALSFVSLALAWVVAQTKSGDLVLPAIALGVIPIVQTVIGMLSPSVTPQTNLRAARMAKLVPPALGCFAFLLIACSACTKAQGTAVETVTVDTTICVLTHFSDPPEQIATECGLAAVEDVVKILDAAHAMQARLAADAGSVSP